MYTDRPDGNYSAVLPDALGGHAHCILAPTADRGSLYLGPEEGGQLSNLRILQDAGVTLIINATPRYPNHHDRHISYVRCDVNDEPSATLYPWFDGISERIEMTLAKKQSVFVHCQMGISRSSTLVMAYLIRFHGLTRDQAYVLVKEKRPKVEPNVGFWRQLKDYEMALSKERESNAKQTVEGSSKVTVARASGEGKEGGSGGGEAAVESMVAFLRSPNDSTLRQSLVDFQCLAQPHRVTTYASVNVVNDANAVSDIVTKALSFVYDTSSNRDRVEWFSCVVSLCDAAAEARGMLKRDSEYMDDYWPGEWNQTTVGTLEAAL